MASSLALPPRWHQHIFRLKHENGIAVAAIEALLKIAQQAGLESYTACSRQRIHAEVRVALKRKPV